MITPDAVVTDVGTQFEVRLIGGVTRVRVRNGRVALWVAGAAVDAGAGEQLTSGPAVAAGARPAIARGRADVFGADWAWVTRAAPTFDLEGKTLAEFLDWIGREGAWTVRFAPPARGAAASKTMLHGAVDHLSTEEALDAVLPACGLAFRIEPGGRVVVFQEK